MKHLFVKQEIARLLKEKGFDEPCMAFYTIYVKDGEPEFRYNFQKHEEWFKHNSDPETKNWNDPDCKWSAPLYQQVIDWFIKEHNILVGVDYDSKSYFWFIKDIPETNNTIIQGNFDVHDNYYNALVEGIEESFKLI